MVGAGWRTDFSLFGADLRLRKTYKSRARDHQMLEEWDSDEDLAELIPVHQSIMILEVSRHIQIDARDELTGQDWC